METMRIATKKKKEVVDITDSLEDKVKESGEADGLWHLFLTHTTAALTTADLDPGTDLDMLDAFQEMIPRLTYRHPHDPGHLPDHVLSSLIGTSLIVAVKKGKPVLGTWQRIVLLEFDGPRERELLVSAISPE